MKFLSDRSMTPCEVASLCLMRSSICTQGAGHQLCFSHRTVMLDCLYLTLSSCRGQGHTGAANTTNNKLRVSCSLNMAW